MIRFHCNRCGKGLQVGQEKAGKKGRCPTCRMIVAVPLPEPEPGAALDWQWHQEPLVLKDEPSKECTQERFEPDRSLVLDSIANADDMPQGQRKYPWFIDLWLYPANTPGLINILLFSLLPVFIALVSIFIWFPFIRTLILLGIGVVGTGYILYYLADCIRDSADGGTRAPEMMGHQPSIGTAATQFMEIGVVMVLLAFPAGIALFCTRQFGVWVWLLGGLGFFLCPMALLAVSLFNSSTGFNPFIWLASILSTLIPYLGLVMLQLLLTIGWAAGLVVFALAGLAGILINAIMIYMAILYCHLIGRFYYCNEQRLRWEV